ncbi:hypothetical protein CONCODRAFT_19313 [Conidiobolus coronatus NRRL 28638]|uniref:Galactose oxidase n=1 Tax=Conidiobolus coronatus (strain ATCC 28846 / CBS 209.66 / NRRL 28638) TaxID=796925 RepID=A0A137NYI0_CONC2|nr:hypothetical protein CONCODRAFT_19313 [Conidiobolus coronatus NRRL 28638]|eukprot:KXN67913.1 hypothetical protein CONCODRAFT_19313 [Conidiobolus coronatus NRRL 28638]
MVIKLKKMFILLIYYLHSVISRRGYSYSATIRGDKLYTIYLEYQQDYAEFKVYELKNGSIIDIVNSAKTIELETNIKKFLPEFLDIPGSLQESHNKLWMKGKLKEAIKGQKNSTYKSWVGYINLDDMSLITDSSLIKFPSNENFTLSEYAISTVNNKFGAAIYIVGGVYYFKKENRQSIENSILKYNFTIRRWVDMTYLVKGKLKPLFSHKSVVIDNRYLVMLSGITEESKEEIDIINRNKPNYNFNSLYNLKVFDTFTNNWEYIDIKPDVMDTDIATFEFEEFLATVYDNKIIVIGVKIGTNTTMGISTVITPADSPYIGILDYDSKTWSWSQIYNEDGSKYSSGIYTKDIFVYNDQIILPRDGSMHTYNESMSIQVYDLPSKRMKSTLRSSNVKNIRESDNIIPTYAIVLIALGLALLLLSLSYLLYHKIKKNSSSKNNKIKYKGPIREVWSNPDIDNTDNIIMWDIKKGISIKKKNSNPLHTNELYPNSSNQNTSNMIEFN